MFFKFVNQNLIWVLILTFLVVLHMIADSLPVCYIKTAFKFETLYFMKKDVHMCDIVFNMNFLPFHLHFFFFFFSAGIPGISVLGNLLLKFCFLPSLFMLNCFFFFKLSEFVFFPCVLKSSNLHFHVKTKISVKSADISRFCELASL